MKDDEDIAILLRMFNGLQSDLYEFDGAVDKEFITKYDAELEETIQYLKGLYINLDEVNEMRF